MPVQFLLQYLSYRTNKKNAIKKLIFFIAAKENKEIGTIAITFCNDTFLLALNKNFLKHNTLTDIITFQYPEKKLSGEIFISIPRVKENAKKFHVTFENELHRIITHGILHLCGYKDKSVVKKRKMREKENYYLKYFPK
jgi:probable rRNA maturation factor